MYYETFFISESISSNVPDAKGTPRALGNLRHLGNWSTQGTWTLETIGHLGPQALEGNLGTQGTRGTLFSRLIYEFWK